MTGQASNRTSTPRQNLAAQLRAFESAALEDYRATVTMRTRSDVAESLHVAFQMEEELQRWHWKDVVRSRPFRIC